MNDFDQIALIRLPLPCRLLASACCPDKDLLVLFSRLGGRDRMSLWKMQGSKKWEVDLGDDDNLNEDIVGIAWSSSGQTIAVAYHPPRLSLYSSQNGQLRCTLKSPFEATNCKPSRLSGIWWFPGNKESLEGTIPDIFKRKNIITGSALSILKSLPLLNPPFEDEQKLTATNIFAFQGSQTRVPTKSSLPEVLLRWNTLALKPETVSISSASGAEDNMDGPDSLLRQVKYADDENSLLVIADDAGRVYSFLDGTYYLGSVGLNVTSETIWKFSKRALFFYYPHGDTRKDSFSATLQPLPMAIPLLDTRHARDCAMLSSISHDLLEYAAVATRDIQETWLGSSTFTGARELGQIWLQAFQRKLADFDAEQPNAMLDMICALLTGYKSEGFRDYFGSSEHMSDRALQKWDNTVSDALLKIRDTTSRRIVPALQRLYVVFDELHGWSNLPHFSLFELAPENVKECLDMIQTGIFVASWLADTARTELSHFKNFMGWLRFETAALNNPTERLLPEFDHVEVNSYLKSGLTDCQVDRWFLGSPPQFRPEELQRHGEATELAGILSQTELALHTPSKFAIRNKNESPGNRLLLDRNLSALLANLMDRSQSIFEHACWASARSANVGPACSILPSQGLPTSSDTNWSNRSFTRHHVAENGVSNEAHGEFLQYLATHVASEPRSFLIFMKTPYRKPAGEAVEHSQVAVLECCADEEGEDGISRLEIIGAEFFDDTNLVIIYRNSASTENLIIALLEYGNLSYQDLQNEGSTSTRTREDMIKAILQEINEAHIPTRPVPISRCRKLAAYHKSSNVSLAVNGREGRRTVCVLDESGMTLEVLDMEASGEDE
ncbi:hypothetical protein CONPUDRAFT_134079 [Coniophora puteana RWD-64-598 SS2]|uniref:Anaphase-promoting complex subunit 4 n=1 Tax=Coniophora puteana (strain RWD-64-598) TaxID=741705 RepID=A0A5M3N777_CONPW|nr:uncharacterized protein CONPUDRAFT_134079 [Coniophora puteana RWD-64-598 SS2]EIW86695.1 hypothetical protein CONPUDRAFT_134079 [Coniophora puteana RWD-64-598 SS2]